MAATILVTLCGSRVILSAAKNLVRNSYCRNSKYLRAVMLSVAKHLVRFSYWKIRMKSYNVNIVANSRRTIYIGVTGDLLLRIQQHKEGLIEGYSSKYKLTKLVYYEEHRQPIEAIAREKQLKGWLRARKIALIEEMNPYWRDLSRDWYARDPSLCSG